MIDFREVTAQLFEDFWRVGCFAGFLVGREAARRLVPLGRGTVIFTGASGSLRGKPGFAQFAAAKAGLRMISQSMAREYGAKGVHVAHVVIDGGINGQRLRSRRPQIVRSAARTACSASTPSPRPIGRSIASRARPGPRRSTCGPSRRISEPAAGAVARVTRHQPGVSLMSNDPIVIVSAARTPLGRFQGELGGLPATALGAHVSAPRSRGPSWRLTRSTRP